MKRYWAGQQGLTLVELVAGLTIFILLLSAIVPMLSTSIQAWQIGSSRADLQQTARLAIERLTHSIRYAKTVTVADNGGSLLLKDGNGSSLKFSVSPDTKALCLTIGSGTPQPFAGDGFSKTEGRVVVVANPGNQQRFTVQDMPMQDKNGQVVYEVKQVKIMLTMKDKATGLEYTLQATVVALNS